MTGVDHDRFLHARGAFDSSEPLHSEVGEFRYSGAAARWGKVDIKNLTAFGFQRPDLETFAVRRERVGGTDDQRERRAVPDPGVAEARELRALRRKRVGFSARRTEDHHEVLPIDCELVRHTRRDVHRDARVVFVDAVTGRVQQGSRGRVSRRRVFGHLAGFGSFRRFRFRCRNFRYFRFGWFSGCHFGRRLTKVHHYEARHTVPGDLAAECPYDLGERQIAAAREHRAAARTRLSRNREYTGLLTESSGSVVGSGEVDGQPVFLKPQGTGVGQIIRLEP